MDRKLMILVVVAGHLVSTGYPQTAGPRRSETVPASGTKRISQSGADSVTLSGATKTGAQLLAVEICVLVGAYTEREGRPPSNWEQLETMVGKYVWRSAQEWEKLKRMYAFVEQPGKLPSAKDLGPQPVEGTLLLAPVYAIHQERSKENGRFTIWCLSDRHIQAIWVTESELHNFSAWQAVDFKLNQRRTQISQLPVLDDPIRDASTNAVPKAFSGDAGAALGRGQNVGQPSDPVPAVKEEVKNASTSRVWMLVVMLAGFIALMILFWKRRSLHSSGE